MSFEPGKFASQELCTGDAFLFSLLATFDLRRLQSQEYPHAVQSRSYISYHLVGLDQPKPRVNFCVSIAIMHS